MRTWIRNVRRAFARTPSPRPFRRDRAMKVEELEGRLVPSVTLLSQQPTLRPGLIGINSAQNAANQMPAAALAPPSPSIAASPVEIVEVVNSSIQIFNKATGLPVGPSQSLGAFFGAPAGVTFLDPQVKFDDVSNTFVVTALVNNPPGLPGTSFLAVALSNNAAPTTPADFTPLAPINVTEANPSGPLYATYLRMGYDAGAYVFAMNMSNSPGDFAPGFDHVQVVTIPAVAMPMSFSRVDDPVATDFSMNPASMHGSTGDSIWLVGIQTANLLGGNTLTVVQVTTTSTAPMFQAETNVTVPAYLPPNLATQPGGTLFVGDARVVSAAWVADLGGHEHLVAAQTVGTAGGPDQATWYEIDTSAATPAYVQSGAVTPGTAGADTFNPAVEVGVDNTTYTNGGVIAVSVPFVGMTFAESSATENLSTYVTGHRGANALPGITLPGDATGTTENPIRIAGGTAPYNDGALNQVGAYAGIALDVGAAGVGFWAANQYALSASSPNWGTQVSKFSLDNITFVVQSFEDLFNIRPAPVLRTPTARELPIEVTALDGGSISRTNLVFELTEDELANNAPMDNTTANPAYLYQLVTSYYQLYLRRAPDPSGLAFYVNQLRSFASYASVQASIAGSGEFFTTQAGGSNSTFVTLLYYRTLGRVPDAGGMSYYLNQLAHGTSRTTVAREFLTSTEYAFRIVGGYATTTAPDGTLLPLGYYQRFLRRAPDTTGLNYYVGVERSQGDASVISSIVGSPEYYDDVV